jgi:chromosome segregation ATPase
MVDQEFVYVACFTTPFKVSSIVPRGDIAMKISRLGKPAQSNSSAIAVIECSVRVSPTLARLIRKSAEKELNGASAKDALLTAAGVQPGEIATLQKELQQASEETKRWREKAAHERGQLEQSKIAIAKRDNERAVLLDDLSKAIASLKAAQQQIVTFEARIAELTSTLESRNQELAWSLSLSGLSDSATAVVKTLRDRLARGDMQIAGDAADGVHAVIANLDRPEMRSLSAMITRRTWRVHVIRWLLRIRARS